MLTTRPNAPGLPAAPLRALTVRQPWATLIVTGAKPVENRTWPPPAALVGHRLLIHAARRPAPAAHWAAAQVLTGRDLLPEHLPYGALLGAVTLTGHHPERTCRAATREPCSPWAVVAASIVHWTLTAPRPLPQPLPCLGALGLWRVPDNLCAQLPAALHLPQRREVAPC
jgi:hypothetical protein